MRELSLEQRDHAWFALADAELCRLFYCSLTERGTQHVEELDSFQNALPEPEHVRPTAGGETRHVEEKERRFVGEIIAWLQRKASEHEVDQLVIFASPRMLGAIRKAPLGSLKGRIEEIEGNLMRLEAGQLADHPMVRKLVPGKGAER